MPRQKFTLDHIIAFNRYFDLPPQPIDDTIWNGAINELESTVRFNLPHLHQNGPDHHLLPPDYMSQRVIIHAYSEGLGPANDHIPYLDLEIHLSKPYITATSIEPNKKGYWIWVTRTIFFHRDKPLVSLDVVAPSNPLLCALPGENFPEGFFRTTDIGRPPQI